VKITILGAGSWGIALANVAAENSHAIHLWEFRPDFAENLSKNRTSKDYLPGVRLADSIQVTSDLKLAIENSDILLFVVPTPAVRKVAESINKIGVKDSAIAVTASKGIENDTLCRVSEIIKQEISAIPQENIAVLSGPSHAEEVSRRIPTAVVAASESEESAKAVQSALMTSRFRIYSSTDIVGVEYGGALKNVIAIAAGICDGAGFGDNTKAALQQRGLVEMVRLGQKVGADPMTFARLSGMGDLIVTCGSRHSRNRYVGEQIGKGRKLQEILDEMVMVAEGVKTTRSAYELSKKYNVEMPITEQVFQRLFDDKNPEDALYELMMRGPKEEKWG